MNKNLKPLYKWTGGKRSELKNYIDYVPEFKTYIEPFFGGGATYWYLNNHEGENIINDLEGDIISFLKSIKHQKKSVIDKLSDISKKIGIITAEEKAKTIDFKEAKEKRGKYYYKARKLDREPGLSKLSEENRATRFFLVNQHSFNGMRRFNASGQFNVPYGNYKQLNVDLLTNEDHIKLLKNTKFANVDFEKLMIDKEDTFIYLDPPYTREFKEYTPGDSFGEEDQIRLFEKFDALKKSKAMLIINDSEFIRNLYGSYVRKEYELNYKTNIKNRYDTAVKHLIITNYDI